MQKIPHAFTSRRQQYSTECKSTENMDPKSYRHWKFKLIYLTRQKIFLNIVIYMENYYTLHNLFGVWGFSSPTTLF